MEKKTGPSKERIAELTKEGYIVKRVIDIGQPLYGWSNKTNGASQSDHARLQPYRRTQDQAWSDCNDFVTGNMPATANIDWALPVIK